MSEPKLSAVAKLDYHTADVVAQLEQALEDAKTGKIKSIAMVYEYLDGAMGHTAAFGDYANRNATVGRLQVLAAHITLNELLKWTPDT